MKVEIFRRTVKDRRRGNSYDLLYHLKEGIEAVGDEAIIVHEHRTGPTVEGEMIPTAPMAAMFGYGGDKQLHHTKGRRHTLVKNAKEKGSVVITFDGGICSSFGNVSGHPQHRYRVSLWTPMRNGEFFANGVPSDRWESMKQTFKINQHDWQKTSNPDENLNRLTSGGRG